MKVWFACLVVFALSACSSPDSGTVKTVSYETVDEMREEEAVESSALAQEENPFVRPNELVMLSFRTPGKKQVFVCYDKELKYLVYRFGSKNKVELQFPGKLDRSSFQKFEYSSYFRGGGIDNLGMSLDYLSFTNSAPM